MIKILVLGEIIGIPTVKQIQKNLKNLIEELKIDFTIANADGASDGYGILSKTANYLHTAGINAITSGDFVYNKKDVKNLMKFPFFLRPYNIPAPFGGKGFSVFNIKDNIKIAVFNILGRTNFHKIFSIDPFYSIEKAIDKLEEPVNIIFVDFHGGTTSEIQAMHWHLAGKVTIVAGTQLRVLTSDARIIEDKTAIVTGTGFCGGLYSIGGLIPEIEINKIKNGKFQYSKVDTKEITLQGVLVEVDETTGNAVSIELFKQNISDS